MGGGAGPDAAAPAAAAAGGEGHHQQQQQQQDQPMWRVLWSSRLVPLLVSMLVYAFGFATLVPVLPQLLTDFFAGRRAGRPVDCAAFGPGREPPACQDAHADVVMWTSWTSLVANTFLSFLLSPLVGDLSDTYGRKPFILAGLALSLLPTGVVFGYLTGRLSLLWYYPMTALSASITSVTVALSYAADVLAPAHRTAGFGLIVASFSTGFMVGPLLGRQLHPATAALVAGGGVLSAMAVVALLVPESRPPGATAAAAVASVLPGASSAAGTGAAAARRRRPRPLDACLSLGRSWRLINSSSLFRRLALCMAINGVVSEGIQDMLIQYLQLVCGFNTKDVGLLFVVLGGANLLVQAAALPLLASALGERRLLLAGLAVSAVEQALLALTATKAQAFGAVALGSLAGVSFPAISSIKSTHSRADQQGLVQGALAGIRALAQGLGPLAFAQLFGMCTRTTAAFGYRPWLVFAATCALTVVAAAVAASIPPGLVRPPGGAAAGAGPAPVPAAACAPSPAGGDAAGGRDAVPASAADTGGKQRGAKLAADRRAPAAVAGGACDLRPQRGGGGDGGDLEAPPQLLILQRSLEEDDLLQPVAAPAGPWPAAWAPPSPRDRGEAPRQLQQPQEEEEEASAGLLQPLLPGGRPHSRGR